MTSSAKTRAALLVDDDETIGMLTSFILKREGYAVHWAKDGGEALRFVRGQSAPDLVLLDVMLPVAGGYEVLAVLRAQAGWEKVPVLMLTGKTEEGEAARATAAGANGYVLKPFNPVELAETIRRTTA